MGQGKFLPRPVMIRGGFFFFCNKNIDCKLAASWNDKEVEINGKQKKKKAFKSFVIPVQGKKKKKKTASLSILDLFKINAIFSLGIHQKQLNI